MSRGISDTELIQELHRVNAVIDNDKSPRTKDMADEGKYSPTTYRNHFGSWNEALKEADMKVNQVSDINKEDIIKDIKRISEEYCDGSSPIIVEMRELGEYPWSCYSKLDETYSELLIEAGLETNYRHTKEELLNEIDRLKEELGRRPKCYELKDKSKFSRGTFRNRFGTWDEALVEAGFEPYEHPVGKDNPHWIEEYTDEFGEGWKVTRRKIIERDDGVCRVCYGEEDSNFVDVHHIKPRRKFNVKTEWKEMNSKGNLVTLCRSCHGKFEGKWQELKTDEFIKKAKEEYYRENE